MDGDDDLQFCWDESKAASNVEKHGVPFDLATFVFDDPLRLGWTDPFAAGEFRSVAIGRVEGKILTVVYSVPADDLYRIISARLATPSERNHYEQNQFHA